MNDMEIRQFGPVRFIPGANRGKYPGSHSLYIESDRILIDAGAGRQRLEQLKNTEGVSAVWLSHWHEDHITNLDLFWDVPVYISSLDAPVLAGIDAMIDAYGVEDEFRSHWQHFFEKQLGVVPRKPDGCLGEHPLLELGSTSVEILPTPGHTPGHLAFFFREAKVLFMGDYDLGKFGPWYGDAEASIEKTVQSVQSLRQLPAECWMTSHETGFFDEDPGALWDAYLNVIDKRESKLLALLETPRTLQEIVDAAIVYFKPREPRAFFAYGERAHMEKHLQRLLEKGRIGFSDNTYYIP
jgi:glyoxylase-like metal-dependent hydrolase (beta-lactamase superfamily II)